MTYASTILADSPFAFWRLGEASGTTAADASPNHRDGTYNAGFTGPGTYNLAQTPAILDSDTAVKFDGGYVQVAYAAWMDVTTTISYEAWVKPMGTSNTGGLIGRWGSGINAGLLWINSSSQFEALFTYGGSNFRAIWSTTPTAGAWYHLVATTDNSNVKLYVNGALVATTPITGGSGNIATGSAPLTIGCFQGGSFVAHAYMDEVAAYPTALTAAQVTAHYNAGLTASSGAYSVTVLADTPWGYWPCDDGSGSLIADHSGNSRHMTITGAPLSYLVAGPKGLTSIKWPNSISVNAATSVTPATTTDFTLEAWVYMTALPSTQVTVVSPAAFAASDSSSEAAIGVDNLARPFIRWWNGGDNQVNGSSSLSLNTWHHIVGVGKSGSGVKIRVDKTDVVGPISSVAAAQAHPLWIHGGKTATGTQGDITIANVAYYRAALTDARIDAHFDATNDPAAAPAMQEVSRVHAEVLTTLPSPTERISRVHAEALSTIVPPEQRIARVHTEVLVQLSQPGEWVLK